MSSSQKGVRKRIWELVFNPTQDRVDTQPTVFFALVKELWFEVHHATVPIRQLHGVIITKTQA